MKNLGLINSGLVRQLLRVSSLILMLACLFGCTSTPKRKTDAAATSMQTASAEVRAESRALDTTLISLRALLDRPSGDLKEPFHQYSAALDHFVSSAQRTQATGQRMAEKNAEYFQAWDKQLATIDFEHIRNLSESRRTEVTNRFEEVHRRYVESQDVVQPLISYFQDIRKALETDLTPDGLAAMRGVAQNAETNSVKVQTALATLATELRESGARMSSLVFQNPQTAVTATTAQGGGETP
jgi:hypothetical protein